jgi:hypothetical protein
MGWFSLDTLPSNICRSLDRSSKKLSSVHSILVPGDPPGGELAFENQVVQFLDDRVVCRHGKILILRTRVATSSNERT